MFSHLNSLFLAVPLILRGLGPSQVLVLSGLAPLWVKRNCVVKFRAVFCVTIDEISARGFECPRTDAMIEYEERSSTFPRPGRVSDRSDPIPSGKKTKGAPREMF
jgi:hypothetical protein